MSESRKNTTFRSLLVLLLVLLAGAVAYTKRSPQRQALQTSSPGPALKIHEIVSELRLAIRNRFWNGQEVVSSIVCDQNQECTYDGPATLPAHAWRILGLARDATIDQPDVAVEIDKSLTEWVRASNLFHERISLHQLADAYFVTRDEKLLYWFWERLNHLDMFLKAAYGTANITDQIAFSSATLARQFAQGIQLLRDERARKALIKWGFLPSGDAASARVAELEQKFLLFSERLIIASRNEDSLNTMDLLEGTNLRRMSCWTAWALGARYRATGSREDLLAVKALFRKLKRGADEGKVIKFRSAQNVLPCVASLVELRKADPDFLPFALYLLKQYLLPLLDSPLSQVCSGDGALFTDIRASLDARCASSSKSLADASWLRFILSKELYDIEIR